MLRIDFYVTHLVRHSASAIELVSGQPVTFRFPSGDRKSNQPIDHAALVQLVQESAPPTSVEELKRTGKSRYDHKSEDGTEVTIHVEASGPGSWRLILGPHEKAAVADAPVERFPAAPAAVERFPAAPAPAPAPAAAAAPAPPKVTPEPIIVPKTPVEKKSVPPPAVELTPGEPQINRFLRMMVKLGASDLHLSSTVLPMVRLHGEIQALEQRSPLAPDELGRLIREIMPERNRVEFDEKSDTDFAHAIEGVARFRANVFADRKGIGAVFRQIPFKILTVEQLNLPPRVIDLCWLTKGLVVVTGPTGSGKSTTLAALINHINENRADHLITIEDPVEFVHENKKCLVNQREIGVHTKGFKSALRAALREDPDIVLVGEMRDLETISIAIETAETGHLVFGTLHTTSAISTVDRIIDQFPVDRQAQIRVMLSESLRGVIAQVLCKKKGGGRIAAHEIMMTNAAVSNLIREGKTFQLVSTMQTGKSQGMQTMNDHLFEHVKNGLVEPEEAYMKSNDKAGFKMMLGKANIAISI